MDAVDRIRVAIDAKKLNLKDFSSAVGVPYRTVQRYMARDRSLSSEFIEAISVHLDVSATWILTGRGPMIIEERPIVRFDVTDAAYLTLRGYEVEASAGHGVFAGVETRHDVLAVHRDWIAKRGLKADALCLISVKGDSMNPALVDGELIMLDQSQTALRHGAIFVVCYSDALFVKRIQQLPGNRLQLISSNPDYPPIVIDSSESDQVQVVGRVVASLREW